MYVKMTMSLLLMTIIRQVHLPQQKKKKGNKQTIIYKYIHRNKKKKGNKQVLHQHHTRKRSRLPVPVWTYVLEINSEQPLTAQLEPGVDYILGSPID